MLAPADAYPVVRWVMIRKLFISLEITYPFHNTRPWAPFSNATWKQLFQVLELLPVSPCRLLLYLQRFPNSSLLSRGKFPDCSPSSKHAPGLGYPSETAEHGRTHSRCGLTRRASKGAISCLASNIVLLLMYLWITLLVFLATTSHRWLRLSLWSIKTHNSWSCCS